MYYAVSPYTTLYTYILCVKKYMCCCVYVSTVTLFRGIKMKQEEIGWHKYACV